MINLKSDLVRSPQREAFPPSYKRVRNGRNGQNTQQKSNRTYY